MPRYEAFAFFPITSSGRVREQERPRGCAEHATDCSNRLPHETGIPLAVDLAPGLELLGVLGWDSRGGMPRPGAGPVSSSGRSRHLFDLEVRRAATEGPNQVAEAEGL